MTTKPHSNDEVIKEFDLKFYHAHEEQGLTHLRNGIVGWLRTLLAQKDKEVSDARREELDRIEMRAGSLRQWLNEDRITHPERMVSNGQILYWLFGDEEYLTPPDQTANPTN